MIRSMFSHVISSAVHLSHFRLLLQSSFQIFDMFCCLSSVSVRSASRHLAGSSSWSSSPSSGRRRVVVVVVVLIVDVVVVVIAIAVGAVVIVIVAELSGS